MLVLVALLAVTTIMYPSFWETGNLTNILSQNAPIGLVALGMTYVIVSGNFDLSVGSTLAMGAVVYASLSTDGAPFALGLFAVGGLGILVGIVNGVTVTRLEVNSFIATIGTGAMISGFTYVYSDSKPILVSRPGFDGLGLGEVAGLPWAGIVLIVALVVSGFVLAKTVYGRWIYAVGGNAEATRLAGVRVDTVKTSAFALVGLCAAFGGAVLASQLSVGQATIGTTVALDAFAIVVIGGTSVYGGEGAIWRTAVGFAIISVMSNLFNALTLDTARQLIAKGAILVLALVIDAYARRRRVG